MRKSGWETSPSSTLIHFRNTSPTVRSSSPTRTAELVATASRTCRKRSVRASEVFPFSFLILAASVVKAWRHMATWTPTCGQGKVGSSQLSGMDKCTPRLLGHSISYLHSCRSSWHRSREPHFCWHSPLESIFRKHAPV